MLGSGLPDIPSRYLLYPSTGEAQLKAPVSQSFILPNCLDFLAETEVGEIYVVSHAISNIVDSS